MFGDDPDALVLGHNWTSDLEPEEYKKLLGLNMPSNAGNIEDRGRMLVDDRFDSEGRRLQNDDVATTVDLAADGHMGIVK